MDFVSDALFDGRKFRALTVVDNHTRECLAIEVTQSLTGDDVVRVLTNIAKERHQYPLRTQADNGPEFVSLALDKWAYENGVTLDFSWPGKLTDNPFIESFNGSLRDECLNTNWFMSLEDAKKRSKPRDRTIIIFDRIHRWLMYRRCCLPSNFMNLNPAGFSMSDMLRSREQVMTLGTPSRILLVPSRTGGFMLQLS